MLSFLILSHLILPHIQHNILISGTDLFGDPWEHDTPRVWYIYHIRRKYIIKFPSAAVEG
ncbi:hypothetical protein MTR_8g042330 [Medicago truncatula]|uniref:Transmembrane protein n=1 Tax=Medicago truncatula TaxID=3880 RepID=G7LJ72_MEDTR|nr:hypothetical protein MTR_8g042330 [Medicago truncatula]